MKTPVLLTATLLVAALLGGGAYLLWRPASVPPSPTADEPAPAGPHLAYDGPFENVRPGIAYVGDAACADCHADIAQDYRHHGMARSLRPIAALASQQTYGPEQHNPFQALGNEFHVERDGDRVRHRRLRRDDQGRPIFEQVFEAHYGLGSGNHGVSYLSEVDGFLFQTPISWYGSKQIWDLSPGFREPQLVGRPVHGDCLFCHANQARFVAGSFNRYEKPIFPTGYSIGCERCHGPGERHVAARTAAQPVHGKFDATIVNPKHLSHAEREAVCQQCHLEGEARVVRAGRAQHDFRPGLPLGPIFTTFVHADHDGVDRKAVNHVEQMYLSACFRGSRGDRAMGCTSCHDPHRRTPPSQRDAFYRGKCLTCHQPQSCTAPAPKRQAKADSCIACHMPPYGSSDIVHVASTDHRILRDPTREALPKEGAPPNLAARLWPGVPIVPFQPERPNPRDPALLRDLGIGLVMLASAGKLDPSLHADHAASLLDGALARDPSDVEAWVAKGHAMMMRNRRAAALTAFETALEKDASREDALAFAATLSQSFQQTETAIAYWQRAVERNPYRADYRAQLATLLAGQEEWDRVRTQTEAWLRLAPDSVPARRMMVLVHLRAGDRAAAREEFRKIEALKPPDREALRKWFEEQLGP